MNKLSQVFKALSEPLRLRIIRQLLTNGREVYGEELAEALGIPPYRLSRHLKVLTSTGLVTERREGRWVYYSLAKNHSTGQVLVSLRRLLAPPHVAPATRRRAENPVGEDVRRRPSRRGSKMGTGLAGAKAPAAPRRAKRGANGNGRRMAVRRHESEQFNWNEGPAIPGML